MELLAELADDDAFGAALQVLDRGHIEPHWRRAFGAYGVAGQVGGDSCEIVSTNNAAHLHDDLCPDPVIDTDHLVFDVAEGATVRRVVTPPVVTSRVPLK